MADKDSKTAAKDGGAGEVQTAVDRETEQGFRGIEVDPTPNENYTVAGVVANKPTPETDPEFAESIRPALKDAERRAAGVAER